MKKKLDGKLTLNRETLRTLTVREMTGVGGGATTDGTCTTSESNTVYTCDTCFGPSCKRAC
ncbi:MAG TPA: class I lanthipeptide [Thermoanaerobaculia bacterium]|jgi:hypothetical protein|nr:class I lanthipeptide [Thermoanaerobaculia bacterium]